MNNSQIKEHIKYLKDTITFLESLIVEEKLPIDLSPSDNWKDTLRRVSKIFKENNIHFSLSDLTRFCSKLRKIRPISQYTDEEIIQIKLETDTVSSLLNL